MTAGPDHSPRLAHVPLLPSLRLWLACGAFWILLTLVGTQSNLAVLRDSGRASTWLEQFHRVASGTGLWLLASPFMVTWSARHPLRGPRDWRRYLLFGGVGVTGIMIASPVASLLRDGWHAKLMPPWLILRSPGLLIELLQFAFFIAAGQLWAVQRRLREHQREVADLAARQREIESQLTDARLRTLRMHVHPHFMFNALNSVTALQRRGDTRAAIAMLVRLGELMRLAMDEDAPHTVPLSRELETLEHYLAIERERFGDRLSVEVEIAATATDALVPYLILQPLVENAIRHGLARLETPARIRVSAVVVSGGTSANAVRGDMTTAGRATDDEGTGDIVQVTVVNDAPPHDGVWEPAREPGRGVQLTQQRLDAMYGDTHGFSVTGVGGTVTATFRIPRLA